MPVRIIGMIGVTPPSSKTSLHVIEGGLSPAYLSEFARAHDRAGFDMVLVGYSSSSAEGFLVALYAAMRTERIAYLIAHRPGFVAPTLLARKIATFDHLTGGRLAVHIITGKSDDEQHGDGDFSPKDERYRRAAEYLRAIYKAAAYMKKNRAYGIDYLRKFTGEKDDRVVELEYDVVLSGRPTSAKIERAWIETSLALAG